MFLAGFKKTAGKDKKKKRLKFKTDMGQHDICKFIKKKADHIMETGYASGKPKDFEWTYIEKHPLDFTKPIKKDWKAWFDNEQQEWVYNHGPKERAGHFDKWSEEPSLKPIVLVHGEDGKLHIWDGHHRIGKALSLGMKSVPALVGTKKSAEKLASELSLKAPKHETPAQKKHRLAVEIASVGA